MINDPNVAPIIDMIPAPAVTVKSVMVGLSSDRTIRVPQKMRDIKGEITGRPIVSLGLQPG